MVQRRISLINKLVRHFPLILLYFSVLNEFDIDAPSLDLLSFNLPFIIIFYWSLKRIETLGYGYIFIAGLFNDVVIGFPIGISSLTYLVICGFAAYLRNISLRPSLVRDWFYFLFTILIANSINYLLLVLFFQVEPNYYLIASNILFTFLLYYIFLFQ